MFQFIKSILSDVDNQGSSKRVAMLWLSIPIWSFIGFALFYKIKPFNEALIGDYIMYTTVLISAFGGMALSEKVWGRPKVGDVTPVDQANEAKK